MFGGTHVGPSSLDFEGLSKKSQLKDTELIRQRGKEEKVREVFQEKGTLASLKTFLGIR